MKENQTSNTRICPSCNQPLPPDAPEGICPECVMMGGLATVAMAPGDMPPLPIALPESGEVFGSYRIGRELGRGGMGAVFEAEQIDTGRRVALKLLKHELGSPEAQARFLREGRLAASINHPNSVYVFGTEKIGDIPAITMELVGGSNLQERVKNDGAMAVGEAVDSILQIISGLEAAAEVGILHRDIKPANCFEEIGGQVKIGDFGLSISTEAREDNPITLDGTVFGTPAFASPEQLRGDELNVRSDIYSVGSTLYFLLTGTAPFSGKTMGGLIANVLEKKPDSVRELRPEVPVELAAAVSRCLSKSPSERIASYAELREALTPFSLETPEPAPVPLRLGAGMIDWLIFGAVTFAFQLLIWGNAAIMTGSRANYIATLVFSIVVWVVYFACLESRKGYSLGKLLLRLRVIDKEKNPPGVVTAGLRALAIMGIPSSLIWIVSSIDPMGYASTGAEPKTLAVGLSYYAILAILFSTARKKNRYRSLVDQWTGTQVVRRLKILDRPALESEPKEPVDVSGTPTQIGPYQIIEDLEEKDDIRWHVGYDSRLLRKVWLRTVPAGFPEVAATVRQRGRAGRLRWLAGRRTDQENWDAYEYPGGSSLLSLLENKQPSWEMVRYWLLDLFQELEISVNEQADPDSLSLSRVWISEKGRAKLLDFPAPGHEEGDGQVFDSPNAFLAAISNTAERPVPLHAAETQEYLSHSDVPAGPYTFSSMIHRVPKVTKGRRAAMVASCLAFPIVSSILLMYGVSMMVQNQKNNPEITSLNQLLAFRNALHSPLTRSGRDIVSDRTFKIYIAEHYRKTIENPEKWDSPVARLTIQAEPRAFAEESLSDSLNPTKEEILAANKELAPIIKGSAINMDGHWWFPIPAGIMNGFLFVGIPAILSALIFRRGLVMTVFGVAVANTDGTPASRLRAFIRSLVTWLIMPLSLVLMFLVAKFTGAMAACVIILVLLLALVGFSLWLPERGLQDRISGTRLIPR